MATTKVKKTRMKEAEPMVDQNMAPAPAVPATQNDLDQAPAPMPGTDPMATQTPAPAPTEAPVDDVQMPAEPMGEVGPDLPQETGLQMTPATVGMTVQVPVDQLSQAVAMATGDVEPAETAPDAVANAEADLPMEEPMVAEEQAPEGTAPVEEQAPVEQTPAPVMESQMREADISQARDQSEKATKHDEDKLQDIIATGVKNTAEGLSNTTNSTATEAEDKLDLMKKGVENTAEGFKEACEDCCPKCGKNPCECEEPMKEAIDDVTDDIDGIEDAPVEEAEPEVEDADVLDDIDVDAIDEGTPEVDGMAPGDGLDDIDDMFDGAPDTDEMLAKIEDFVNMEDKDTDDVADALRTAASFLDQIADDKKFKFDDVLGDDYEETDDETVEDASIDEEPVDDEVMDDEEIEVDDMEDEPEVDEIKAAGALEEPKMKESFERKICRTPRRATCKPVVTPRHVLHESSIIYPAGSAPQGREPEVDMVESQAMIHESRRKAIENYRRSVRESRVEDRERFNEALNASVQTIRESEDVDPNSWEANTFIERYEESSKLNYRELLRNGFLG